MSQDSESSFWLEDLPRGYNHMLAGAVNYVESGMGLTDPLPRQVFEMAASWDCLMEGAFGFQQVSISMA